MGRQCVMSSTCQTSNVLTFFKPHSRATYHFAEARHLASVGLLGSTLLLDGVLRKRTSAMVKLLRKARLAEAGATGNADLRFGQIDLQAHELAVQ